MTKQTNPKRFAKADSERFNGKPRINKLKPDNIAEAGEYAKWAEDFARKFTDALPCVADWNAENPVLNMSHWLVGVKVCEDPNAPKLGNMLRLKVANDARDDNAKRCWVYVNLGSKKDPVELAHDVTRKMSAQPSKHAVVEMNGRKGKFGASHLHVK